MTSRVFETSDGTATLRRLTGVDERAWLALGQTCNGLGGDESRRGWGAEQFHAHIAAFPDGQLGVEVAGELVGSVSSHIVRMGHDGYRPHTLAGITEDGYFHNHDSRGDTLYLSQMSVASERCGRAIATELVGQLLELCRRSNLRRVFVAVPLEAAAETQPEGADSVNVFLAELGFAPRATLRGYARRSSAADSGSADVVLLEWANGEYRAPRAADAAWVRVALVQYQMRGIQNFDDFANQVEYFVQAASGYEADFVLFPEFTSLQLLSSSALRNQPPNVAIENLSHLTDDVFGLFSRLARRHGLHIIGGSHPVRATAEHATLHNVCPIALPDGRVFMQPKLHITPSETAAWGLRGGAHLAVIPTPKAKIGVLICYDSEFPEAARHLADQGVDILFVPYCTDDRQGHLRVRLCCQARAVENQIYVATAGLIGNLPGVAGLDVHYGRAGVFTPSDFTFARDAIQAQADANVETLLVTDLDLSSLYRAREHGSVRPRLDRRPDLFELKANFASSGLPEYSLGNGAHGAG